ncbi:MAG: biopolymer transporter ExbD [Acidobacteriota bacterium]|nr:biopolymer transporter ExbD [Acidobacteriota bacterium]
MRLKARMQHEGTIPTASMADIAFLLIIFFMLTITFEVDKTQVALPKTELRFEVPKKAAFVSVDDNGQLRVSDGEEMSAVVPGVDDVLSFAAGVVATDPGKAFVVKAGTATQYQHVDKVIDALKRAKVEMIYLLSDQETIAVAGG